MPVENATWVDEIWWEGNKRLQWSLMKGKQFHLAKLKQNEVEKEKEIFFILISIFYTAILNQVKILRENQKPNVCPKILTAPSPYVELMP